MGPEIVVLLVGRNQGERLDYNTIVDKNLFAPYQPRIASTTVTPTTEPAHPTTPVEPTVRPVVDPRAGADQKFVRSTVGLDGEPRAYVVDKQQLDQPPTAYRLDDPIDDGKLILIHPQGIVVRSNGKNYFYPLGSSFRDREELSAADRPEIWDALRREFL